MKSLEIGKNQYHFPKIQFDSLCILRNQKSVKNKIGVIKINRNSKFGTFL